MKWTKVLRTGALGVRFMGVDLNTIMFNMEQGQDMIEITCFCVHLFLYCFIPFFILILQFKEFVLNRLEAYEIKIGDQVFRRPGDPPLEEVVEKLQNEKKRVENESPTESNRHLKEEL
ncbi:unnamed protein product [Prunus brigantina]